MSDSTYLIDHLSLALVTDPARAPAGPDALPSIDEAMFVDSVIRDGGAIEADALAPWVRAMRTSTPVATSLDLDDPRLADLCRGLSFDEFHPVFQSVVRLEDGRTVGAEALARWAHPVHGTLLPEAFVPLADRSGLLAALGSRILAGACARLADWQAVGHLHSWVSVNLSASQLASPRLHEEVAEAIARHPLAARTLVLEVAESTLADRPDAWMPRMHALRATGARLALDNAGTGRMTLAQIATLPVDIVKIDRSLVARLPVSSAAQAWARALVALCRRRGLPVVGKGVERVPEREALVEVGCPLAQGFLFSTPTRSPDFDW